MAEKSLSTKCPVFSLEVSSALSSNPGWNLAPDPHLELELATAMSPAAFAAHEPTDEETAALTAIAAEAAAEAAANATADQESMDYVEVLLELPPSPPGLACTQPDSDVKPHASHLRMALENYDKQQQWDNYNYPTAMKIGKSVAGLNPLFNPSGHNPKSETVVVGSGARSVMFSLPVNCILLSKMSHYSNPGEAVATLPSMIQLRQVLAKGVVTWETPASPKLSQSTKASSISTTIISMANRLKSRKRGKMRQIFQRKSLKVLLWTFPAYHRLSTILTDARSLTCCRPERLRSRGKFRRTRNDIQNVASRINFFCLYPKCRMTNVVITHDLHFGNIMAL